MHNKFYFFKGRVALYAILKAMGIKQDDEVILPGFTCIVVPNAIAYLGAKPIYVDIDPSTYNIDPGKIGEKITVKTKAIIAQHTFGIPADMDRITEIAKRHNLFVIEDSCHAIGSKYKRKEVGSFGDAAFFSSQWSKPVTTGLGGWAVINNVQLLQKMELINQEVAPPSIKESLLLRFQYHIYSMIFKPSLFWLIQDMYRKLSNLGITIGSITNEELECRMPERYEKKMSLWQINLLERRLTETEKMIAHRKWITSIYEEILSNKGIAIVKLSEDSEPVFLRYPILVQNKREILKKAREKRIQLGDWFVSPVHDKLDNWERAGYTQGMCPNAEAICEHIINLPTHRGIKKREAEKLADFISAFNK